MTEDHNRRRIGSKEILSIPRQPEAGHGYMDKQQRHPSHSAVLDMKRHRIRPDRTGRVHISPDIDRAAVCLKFSDEIEVSYVPGMEDKSGAMTLKRRKQVGMRSSVGVRDNRKDRGLAFWQLNRSGRVSMSHGCFF